VVALGTNNFAKRSAGVSVKSFGGGEHANSFVPNIGGLFSHQAMSSSPSWRTEKAKSTISGVIRPSQEKVRWDRRPAAPALKTLRSQDSPPRVAIGSSLFGELTSLKPVVAANAGVAVARGAVAGAEELPGKKPVVGTTSASSHQRVVPHDITSSDRIGKEASRARQALSADPSVSSGTRGPSGAQLFKPSGFATSVPQPRRPALGSVLAHQSSIVGPLAATNFGKLGLSPTRGSWTRLPSSASGLVASRVRPTTRQSVDPTLGRDAALGAKPFVVSGFVEGLSVESHLLSRLVDAARSYVASTPDYDVWYFAWEARESEGRLAYAVPPGPNLVRAIISVARASLANPTAVLHRAKRSFGSGDDDAAKLDIDAGLLEQLIAETRKTLRPRIALDGTLIPSDPERSYPDIFDVAWMSRSWLRPWPIAKPPTAYVAAIVDAARNAANLYDVKSIGNVAKAKFLFYLLGGRETVVSRGDFSALIETPLADAIIEAALLLKPSEWDRLRRHYNDQVSRCNSARGHDGPDLSGHQIPCENAGLEQYLNSTTPLILGAVDAVWQEAVRLRSERWDLPWPPRAAPRRRLLQSLFVAIWNNSDVALKILDREYPLDEDALDELRKILILVALDQLGLIDHSRAHENIAIIREPLADIPGWVVVGITVLLILGAGGAAIEGIIQYCAGIGAEFCATVARPFRNLFEGAPDDQMPVPPRPTRRGGQPDDEHRDESGGETKGPDMGAGSGTSTGTDGSNTGMDPVIPEPGPRWDNQLGMPPPDRRPATPTWWNLNPLAPLPGGPAQRATDVLGPSDGPPPRSELKRADRTPPQPPKPNPPPTSMFPPATQFSNDYTHVVYKLVNCLIVTLADGARSWRNNNPGNLAGGCGGYHPLGFDRSSNGMAVFPDVATGWNALRCLINTNSGLTIPKLIQKWAPRGAPNDPTGVNDPVGYAARIKRMTGLDLTVPIFAFSDDQREQIGLAIMTVEGDQHYFPGKVEQLGYWEVGTTTASGTLC